MANQLTFGKKLAALRKEKGYTSQKAFAKALGLAPATINYYENDQRKPDFETFGEIADLLDVPYDYLLGKSTNRKRENIEIGAATGLSDYPIRLMDEYRNDEIEYTSPERFVIDRADILNAVLGNFSFYFMLDRILDAIGMLLIARSYGKKVQECTDEAVKKNMRKIESLVIKYAAQQEREIGRSAISIVERIQCDIAERLPELASSYIDENASQRLRDIVEHEIHEREEMLTYLHECFEAYGKEKEATENGDDNQKK